MSHDASLVEIRRAYRRLVRRFHPDLGGGHAVEQFHAVQAAWEVLRDAERRRRHRQTLEAEEVRRGPAYRPNTDRWSHQKPPTEPAPPRPPPSRPPPPEPEVAEPETEPEPQTDPVRYRVSILRSVAAKGGRILTRLPLALACPACGGVPLLRARCGVCSRKGHLDVRVRAWVTVPAGVESGQDIETLAELELYGVRPISVRVDVV